MGFFYRERAAVLRERVLRECVLREYMRENEGGLKCMCVISTAGCGDRRMFVLILHPLRPVVRSSQRW